MTTTAERVWEVRRQVLSGQGEGGASDKLFPVAIGTDEGLALRDWVCQERARHTLETGLGYGVAALFICEGLLTNGADVRHVAIDPYQFVGLDHHRTQFGGAGLSALEKAEIRDLVEFYEEESQTVLPRLIGEGTRLRPSVSRRQPPLRASLSRPDLLWSPPQERRDRVR